MSGISKVISKLKHPLRDMLFPTGTEEQSLSRFRAASRIRLLLIVPVLYGFTLFAALNIAKQAAGLWYDEALAAWITLALVYVAINIVTLISSNIRLNRLLCIASIALELTTNEIVVYLSGTIASHALIFMIISVSVYRVFFDYGQGLFAAVYGIGMHFLDVLLVLTGAVPQMSILYPALASAQLGHYAMLTLSSVIIGVFIAFSTINMGMNRYFRLRRLLSENWKNDLVFLEKFSEQAAGCHDESGLYSHAISATAYAAPLCRSAVVLIADTDVKIQAVSGWKDETLDCVLQDLLKAGFPEEELYFCIEAPEKITVLCLAFECENGPPAYMIIGSDDMNTLNDHRRKMLLNLAQICGNALSSCRRLNDERSRSLMDELTGVYNKRYFLQVWHKWVDQALSDHNPMAVAVFDIDNFKGYNDTFGHVSGDKLLRRVAQTILSQLRDRDVVARFGGEEFVVMLENADLSLGFLVAERIRDAIQQLQGDEILRPVTISGGIAALPDDPHEPSALLECADQRLYYAKRNGRNRNHKG